MKVKETISTTTSILLTELCGLISRANAETDIGKYGTTLKLLIGGFHVTS